MNYIYVSDNDNNKKKMEVVKVFDIEEYPYSYIIYKELDHPSYYLAKIMNDSNELDTNLSKREIAVFQTLFERMMA